MPAKTFARGIAIALVLAATPALARHDRAIDYPASPANFTPPVQNAFQVDRALAERCGLRDGSMRPHLTPAYLRDGYGRRRDDGLVGAAIGGVTGGLIGNRIAGHGDRLLGTTAGAVVGAAAGAAIDRAEDRGAIRSPALSDDPQAYGGECDAVLPPGYMLVSVPGEQDCHDEVVTREEWVPE
ncbi:glycine zipper 2TM domain-containing protein [Novosphingobium sp. Gsoil 351]|uniref:glycine zipper 2TM domain-containing protein n=1 Tax=Novosphingobium sp. Gsoil 351 TaxID=2675225 RepID=UPI0012B4BD4E|nr:glycine zipper 2TM domain-containing protein [Novosphingobium sp. Gsoil 351]QGN54900.1 glycine zipper 2TM domain-containing protein [Novosphingobium sp. Gsoil 351]